MLGFNSGFSAIELPGFRAIELHLLLTAFLLGVFLLSDDIVIDRLLIHGLSINFI